MQSPERRYYQALLALFQGKLEDAHEFAREISTDTFESTAWLRNYLHEVVPIQSGMVRSESEHFILKTRERDRFLSDYALAALGASVKVSSEITGENEVFRVRRLPRSLRQH